MRPEDLIKEIIKEQSAVIGDELARVQAVASGAVKFNSHNLTDISVVKEPPVAIESIIQSYKMLFGQASVEVCISIIKKHSHEEVCAILPDSIRTIVHPMCDKSK